MSKHRTNTPVRTIRKRTLGLLAAAALALTGGSTAAAVAATSDDTPPATPSTVQAKPGNGWDASQVNAPAVVAPTTPTAVPAKPGKVVIAKVGIKWTQPPVGNLSTLVAA